MIKKPKYIKVCLHVEYIPKYRDPYFSLCEPTLGVTPVPHIYHSAVLDLSRLVE